MPSWGIHLKLAKKLNKKLNLDDDLFTFGNLVPDVDKSCIIGRRESHYYTGIKFVKCPSEYAIDIDEFINDYKDKLNNSIIIGYYCHLLTDKFYNEYIYSNKWIQDENNNIIGIRCSNGNIINLIENNTLKYKHHDLEKYARFIYNEEELFIPNDVNKIVNNISILKNSFYSIENVKDRINYLNNGEFKRFNNLTDDDINNKNEYIIFTKDELDNLFDDCYLYIIDNLKKVGII